MSVFHLLIAILLLAWQTAGAVYDFHDRRIPVGFSLVPLIAGLVYFGIMSSPVAAILLLVSILATNFPTRFGFGLTAIPAAFLVFSAVSKDHLALFIGWIILWILWLLGVMGGADALAGMVLLIWFPSPLMLGALLAGLFFWSLGMLLIRHGGDMPLRVWVVIRQGWSKSSRGLEHLPGLGAFPLAMALFLVCQLYF
jgi:Flp pilus assembly protein protease CpaA